MPYILLAAVIFSFGSGFGAARSVYILEIEELKASISESNNKQQALKVLNEQKLTLADKKAKELNLNLDKSHEAYIQTANAYNSKFNTLKLYDHKTSCGNKMSKSYNSERVVETRTNEAELSTELTRFLRQESLRADKAAIDKNTLLEFIKSNCGVSNDR